MSLMAAQKPRTGDGPLEIVRESRSIILRIPLEGGGRLVLDMSEKDIEELKESLKQFDES